VTKDPLDYKGYIAGYWDGVKDTISGKVTEQQSSDIGKLPIHAMKISTRAHNCLLYSGCRYVEDVIALDSNSILTMRNLGSKSASEIANWLAENGVFCSAWMVYL